MLEDKNPVITKLCHRVACMASAVLSEMWVKCFFFAATWLTHCLALQEDCTQVGRKTKNLTIQLQVSQSPEFDLSGYIPAVEAALGLINTNSCVLPDYHISFNDIVDSQVSRKPLLISIDILL